jgi:hypothetical protein
MSTGVPPSPGGPILGTLTRVEARAAWTDEARHFTPWLAANLVVLSEALGLDLELVETEVHVGDFSVDIVARDRSSGAQVIIENQLERTDHGHLGQLLTYAAGQDSAMIVWISPAFRDEHRQALDWLNANTGEGRNFFGVEIELLRIDQSPPAPHFKVVAQPNEWAKATKSSAAGAPSELGLRYQKFFRGILERFGAVRPDVTTGSRVGTNNWYTFATGRRGFGFVWSMSAKNRFRVELYIDAGAAEENADFLERLRADAAEIETAVGEQVEWELLENRRACRMAIYRKADQDNFENEPELTEWAVQTMSRFVDAMRPRIKAL